MRVDSPEVVLPQQTTRGGSWASVLGVVHQRGGWPIPGGRLLPGLSHPSRSSGLCYAVGLLPRVHLLTGQTRLPSRLEAGG